MRSLCCLRLSSRACSSCCSRSSPALCRGSPRPAARRGLSCSVATSCSPRACRRVRVEVPDPAACPTTAAASAVATRRRGRPLLASGSDLGAAPGGSDGELASACECNCPSANGTVSSTGTIGGGPVMGVSSDADDPEAGNGNHELCAELGGTSAGRPPELGRVLRAGNGAGSAEDVAVGCPPGAVPSGSDWALEAALGL
mmetsp:Transcript_48042/g.137208  ORF Transcript_48042/g.137208 Transcript_48042/m.137208 type:complete len:200 (+) Transcript_48042:144-743(+)